MEISVELTFSPLQNQFEKPIQEFIKTLRSSGFEILENPLSTQVYGDYTQVMTFLTAAIEKSLGDVDNGLFYMKIVKSDRSDYVPNF
ncbi:hypothetical protein [Dokdonia sp. Hel_I_53]|uniref:hypothetical protein n=1 Tax=Dokdonia sp. Hel_I_53 TaxID=1566287 RepID=UPI00119C0853|nr:hypothetical protein [Dokdonia sp. Hel_I_53]TVZ52833.1 hypothetical protein OD90_2017 [Dokdonia sp. Hel_I_53]